jgi:hypothetical protein
MIGWRSQGARLLGLCKRCAELGAEVFEAVVYDTDVAVEREMLR